MFPIPTQAPHMHPNGNYDVDDDDDDDDVVDDDESIPLVLAVDRCPHWRTPLMLLPTTRSLPPQD